MLDNTHDVTKFNLVGDTMKKKLMTALLLAKNANIYIMGVCRK